MLYQANLKVLLPPVILTAPVLSNYTAQALGVTYQHHKYFWVYIRTEETR